MEVMDSPYPPLTSKKPTTLGTTLIAGRSPAEKKDLSRRARSLSPSTISCHTPSSSSYSSSSSSSSSTITTTSSSPHPSSLLTPSSPFISLSSSVPFSWESQPGIPKTSPTKPTTPKPALPLPPVLLSRPSKHHHRRRPKKSSVDGNGVDPFTVALMQCSKDEEEADNPWKPPAKKWVDRRRMAPFGLMSSTFDLYASCKSTCSVADSCICARRAGGGGTTKMLASAYGILPRRPE